MTAFKTSALTKFISILLSFLLLFNTVGCGIYYQANKLSAADKPNIDKIGTLHKYFVIHHGDNVFSCSNISADMENISGDIDRISPKFYFYDDQTSSSKKYDKGVLNEVHIYMKEGSPMPIQGNSKISLQDVKEIRIIEINHGATLFSYILGTAAVVGALYIIIVIIILLTKSSCPYVYVYNGNNFVFEGEIYGGAIASNLERDDFMPLPSIMPENDSYMIKINNELKECQYTDLAQLLVVEHRKDQKVLLDKYGRAHVVGEPQSPVEALSCGGDDLENVLKKTDNEVYFFNDDDYLKNSIVMKFRKTENASDGKLLIKAKNTLWFDYIFGDFLSKFGASYEKWTKKQSQISPEERQQKILDNDFPLTAYVKKNNKWQIIDYLNTVGPLASREFVLPVDLSGTGEDIEIKVETGFMFWEIDYAAMDFTDNSELQITALDPETAIDEKGMDRSNELVRADGNYMVQNYAGLSTEVTFKAQPVKEGMVNSVFLHTRGYYELIREFSGLPDLKELNKFKTPGYFSEYSRSEYLKAVKKEDKIICFKPAN